MIHTMYCDYYISDKYDSFVYTEELNYLKQKSKKESQ